MPAREQWSVDHSHHVRELGDRTADFGGIFELHHAVHLAQTETDEDLLLGFGATG